jgi:hypothetical protein
MITEKSIVKASEKVLFSEIEKEAVILGIQSGRYFGLNDIATVIWNQIESPKLVKDIISELSLEYSGDKTTIKDDILLFLSELYNQHLIEIENEGQPD